MGRSKISGWGSGGEETFLESGTRNHEPTSEPFRGEEID
jgi:hypothetical protein